MPHIERRDTEIVKKYLTLPTCIFDIKERSSESETPVNKLLSSYEQHADVGNIDENEWFDIAELFIDAKAAGVRENSVFGVNRMVRSLFVCLFVVFISGCIVLFCLTS